MAEFKLRDRVRRKGQQEIRTVEEIRENPAAETKYWIQLGTDFATRLWADEGELELLCSECEKPAAEIRQQLREKEGIPIRWPVCQGHAKHYDGLAEALLGPDPSSE
jgi:hypothetical protein